MTVPNYFHLLSGAEIYMQACYSAMSLTNINANTAYTMISVTDVPLWVSGYEGVTQTIEAEIRITHRFMPEAGTDWRCYQRNTHGGAVDIANPVIRTNRVNPVNTANYKD